MYVGDTSQASVLTKPLSMADLSEANKAVLVEACQVLGAFFRHYTTVAVFFYPPVFSIFL